MQIIPTPKNIKFNALSGVKGEFIIEPLYPGYGITIGNALRRVLYSSMPGAAITSVKIEGVTHEFSTLPYVKEDIVDVILNIKQINLSVEGEIDPSEPLVIKLEKIGEGKVTAGDIKCPTQVKVANKDQLIATLTDKAAKLNMEFIVEKGMGYIPTENRETNKFDIGHIAVDSVYTPIVEANIKTEHVRVGEMTDWDKLILTIETNGTIKCGEAFKLAVGILSEQFDSLEIGKEDSPKIKKAKTEEEPVVAGQENIIENEKEKESAEEAAEEEKPKKRGRPKKEDK